MMQIYPKHDISTFSHSLFSRIQLLNNINITKEVERAHKHLYVFTDDVINVYLHKSYIEISLLLQKL